jgi:hypothetical protein
VAVPDANTPPSSGPSGKLLDRVKGSAAVLGAITAALTGLWGVYEKVRAEARAHTASSYNTLAPQLNQVGEAVKQLQQENQQLRELVARYQGQPRIAAEPPRRATTGRRPASAPRPAEPAPGAPAQPAPAPAATPPAATPSAEAPPSGPPPTEPTAAAKPGEPQAEPKPDDPVGGLLQAVDRTRAAIESLRKVPEDFEKVAGDKK